MALPGSGVVLPKASLMPFQTFWPFASVAICGVPRWSVAVKVYGAFASVWPGLSVACQSGSVLHRPCGCQP